MLLTTTPRRLVTATIAVIACAALTTLPASAQEKVTVNAGDGGLVEAICGSTSTQVRVDSASVAGMSACFELNAPTGWVAVNITGSYGVVNNLNVPVSVAFKLPDGEVYWQQVIQPGQVRSVDVDRHGSTIVELQVTPVASPTGASTGNLTASAEQPNYVTLRSAGTLTSGQVMRVGWSGVEMAPLDRNSGFNNRLDASFKVVDALNGSECISLESASYPGVYLIMDNGGAVSTSYQPNPQQASWCPTSVDTPPTGVRLASAVNQSRVLTVSTGGKLSTSTVRTNESIWFTDQALALPGY